MHKTDTPVKFAKLMATKFIETDNFIIESV